MEEEPHPLIPQSVTAAAGEEEVLRVMPTLLVATVVMVPLPVVEVVEEELPVMETLPARAATAAMESPW